MKYLVHVSPTPRFSSFLDSYRHTLGVADSRTNMDYCTLMCSQFDEADEETIVESLDEVVFSPFTVRAGPARVFEEYGSPYVGELYAPHVTVSQVPVGTDLPNFNYVSRNLVGK